MCRLFDVAATATRSYCSCPFDGVKCVKVHCEHKLKVLYQAILCGHLVNRRGDDAERKGCFGLCSLMAVMHINGVAYCIVILALPLD
jgi:hypothetical protein